VVITRHPSWYESWKGKSRWPTPAAAGTSMGEYEHGADGRSHKPHVAQAENESNSGPSLSFRSCLHIHNMYMYMYMYMYTLAMREARCAAQAVHG